MPVAKPAPGLFLFLFLSLVTACIACGDDDDDGSDAGSDGQTSEPAPPLFQDRDPDETLRVEGISARVEIARDEFGIPHIFASNMNDGAFAQGYMQARDRFFQMDLFRHMIEGRLTEYFGSLALDFDIDNRAFMMTTDGRQVYEVIVEQMEDNVRGLIEAYSAGVTQYIKEIKAGDRPLPGGYGNALLVDVSADIITDWSPADTMAIGRMLEQQLSDETNSDIARGELLRTLPADIAEDILRFQPADTVAVLPEFYDSEFYRPDEGQAFNSRGSSGPHGDPNLHRRLYAGVELGRVLKARTRTSGFERMPREARGSNNWVIAGEHTESGNPMVLNDPHLSFMNPPLFYHTQLDTVYYGSESQGEKLGSAMGIQIPGLPGILIGHNQNVAWGLTTVGWDVSDVYVETLNEAGDAVLFNGDWVDIVQYEMQFKVLSASGFETVTEMVEMVPHHGAILRGTKQNGRALTSRWTAHEPIHGADTLIMVLSARNIDEWMDAVAEFAAGAQNWNGADVYGDTGYLPAAVIPIRKSISGECDPSKPVDGTGPCEWIGYLHRGQIPHTKNRPTGYVVTANNDITGTLADNDPFNDEQYLRRGAATGFRARRITDRIEEMIASGSKITRQQMIELQADTYSIEAERILPFVFDARDALPDRVAELGLQTALSRLAAWDRFTPSGVDAEYRTDGGPDAAEIESSIAASIFYAFAPRFYQNIYNDEAEHYGAGSVGTKTALYLLENPDSSATGLTLFDDIRTVDVVETPHDIILKSLREALDFLESELGADQDQWQWGKLHRIAIPDPFGWFMEGLSTDTLGPYPRGGANLTVDVASTGGNTTDFTYGGGPQMRFYAELSPDGVVSENSLPGGQVAQEDSPHRADLLPGWMRNETFPYYFTPEDVVAHTEELIALEPASEPVGSE